VPAASRVRRGAGAPGRAARLDEGLGLLRRLPAGEQVGHDGAHFAARDVRVLPPATRPGGIPSRIGGRWPDAAPLRRAARYEGAFVISLPGPGDLAGVRQAIAGARGGDLAGSAVGVELPADADCAPWETAGATWVLTRPRPYRLDVADVRRVVRRGPR